MAGIDFAATEKTSFGARYRFLDITGLSLMDGSFRHDYDSKTLYSVEFVLTHHFGSPAPAP